MEQRGTISRWVALRGKLVAGVVLMLAMPLMIVHRIAFAMDELLFPSLGSTPIERPLFIVGIPRSGTTLSHRLIASCDDTFTSMPLWELLFAPALCEKYCVSFVARIDRFFGGWGAKARLQIESKLFGSLSSIHATQMDSPEEDYLGLLPFGGCFLSVLVWPARKSVWDLAYLDSRMPEDRRRRLVGLYRGLLQRHLAFRGGSRHLVSKNPNMVGWINALAEQFPDARFIGLRRDLCQSLPSQLSSIRQPLSLFGNDVRSAEIVESFLDLFAHHWNTLDENIDRISPDRYRLIEYPDLKAADVAYWIELIGRLGYDISSSDTQMLGDAVKQASVYQSRHVYSLNEFGLDRQRISAALDRNRRDDCGGEGTPRTERYTEARMNDSSPRIGTDYGSSRNSESTSSASQHRVVRAT